MNKRDSDDLSSEERRKLIDRSSDDSVLTGWYNVVNWVLHLVLSDPIDASFLRQVTNADVIESIDLYVRYEPQVAVLYATGMLFFAVGIVGSVLYPLVRRRGLCGGDRTQDLNENMRCILQVYTAAYIVLLACILLGGMLMLASMFELRQSSAEHKKGFAEYANSVRMFFLGMAKVAKQQQDENVRYLNELHRTLTDFSTDLRNHLLPKIKTITTTASGILKAEDSDVIPPVADSQLLESGRQDANKDAAQQAMAVLIATQVGIVYNDSLFECRMFAKDGSDRIAKFCQAVVNDIDKSSRSFVNISSSMVRSDQLGILETLRSKGHWYVFLVLGSFLLLFLLYTGSFILGMFHYNEDIPPTKRTDASNYAGTAMLVAIVLSFPVCAALMLVCNTIMLLALSITNFGCRPYENIVKNWPGSTVDAMVLDDTIDLFWPRQSRGRWFGSFLAGTTLQLCREGKVFDVIGADYKLAVDGYDEFLDNLHHLMISITVDPRMIFPATPPPELANYYDSMKQVLWDKVGDMVEGYIKSLARGAIYMRSNLSKFNQDCLRAYDGYERSFGYICEGIIRNVNSFWTSLAFCLYMFTFLGTLSHFVSKYFLRMENYTYDGSEVESLTSTSECELHADKALEVHPEGESAEGGEKSECDVSAGPDAVRRSTSDELDAEGRRIEKGPKWRRGRRRSQVGQIPPGAKLQRMELGDIQDDPRGGVVTASFMTISSTRSFRPK